MFPARFKLGLRSKKRINRAITHSFAVIFACLIFVIAVVPASAPVSREIQGTSDLVKTKANPTPTPEPEQSISFAIGGDVMLDRAVDYNFRGEKLFGIIENIKDSFGKSDVNIVNLEGPISPTEIPADNTANNMIFNFPPRTTEVLKTLGINAISLANNHTNNNGRVGLENTRKVLLDSNIKPIGSETSFDDFSIGRFQRGEKKLSIITINSLEVGTDISGQIRSEKDSGSYVLIFPHWGVEYAAKHNSQQEKLAKAWIDAGADIVIGGHPHVIQDMEVYNGRPIFYSLGNLIFDQTFSRETQEGLILKGKIEDKGITVEIWPVISKKLKPEVVTDADGSRILDTLIAGYESHQIANHPRNMLFFGY